MYNRENGFLCEIWGMRMEVWRVNKAPIRCAHYTNLSQREGRWRAKSRFRLPFVVRTSG